MSCILINMVLLFSSYGSINNDTLPQSIKEIWIYDYFNPRGYTTAGAYGQMIRLEAEGVSKFKLEQSEVDSLCRMLQDASHGKLFHTKLGSKLVFADIILKNEEKIKLIISSYVISVDIFQKNYWVKDEKDIEWLSEFIDRMYEKYSK